MSFFRIFFIQIIRNTRNSHVDYSKPMVPTNDNKRGQSISPPARYCDVLANFKCEILTISFQRYLSLLASVKQCWIQQILTNTMLSWVLLRQNEVWFPENKIVSGFY